VQNSDGLWLRLTAESIREFCSPLNGFTEGWALQYNQHVARTLLVPVANYAAPPNNEQHRVINDRRNGQARSPDQHRDDTIARPPNSTGQLAPYITGQWSVGSTEGQ